MFCSIWVHLGLFRNCTKLDAKHTELVQLMQKFAPRNHVVIFFPNKRTWSTPLDPKIMFLCVSYHLGAFGLFGCFTKLGGKGAKLVQKFVPRCHVRIFCNKRTWLTPLDPKLMFWCVSYYLGAIGTVWLPYESQWKMGRTNAKVRATKSRRSFSRRTHPIHPIGP